MDDIRTCRCLDQLKLSSLAYNRVRWGGGGERRTTLKLFLGNCVIVVQKKEDIQSNSQQNLPPLIHEPYFEELFMKWINV